METALLVFGLTESSRAPVGCSSRLERMGLDIYVGSLTRYFARDWKTIVQQLVPDVQVVRPNAQDDAVTDPGQIRPAVLAWRDRLSAGLKEHVAAPLEWDELGTTPYFTDKPAWDCYGALLLWAAYSEHPDLQRPAANPLCLPNRKIGDWHDDPAYRRSVAKEFPTRYSQLFDDVEVWLPCDYRFTFGAPWVTGQPRRFGACGALVSQLDELNTRTWDASPAEVSSWRPEGGDFGVPLEDAAKFAFAIMRELAGNAVEHRLPMLLDY